MQLWKNALKTQNSEPTSSSVSPLLNSGKIRRYTSRVKFFTERANAKKVLHLGCSSGRYLRDRVQRRSLFHSLLESVSSDLYGIDIDADSLSIMRNELGFKNLYEGDVERLEEVPVSGTFDIVVAGDLLEHITCPGAMLEGVKRFLEPSSELIVSTNNAFGLHYQIKRWLGGYVEQFEHVCFYSPETLVHLFQRHGYVVTEMCGAFTENPYTVRQRITFAAALPLFRMFPVLAGTIIVVAVPGKS
jgi:2-polyprenyl-3-methyl-5-hydroxy-6-metoxy-1,4-benzoquinol methylase